MKQVTLKFFIIPNSAWVHDGVSGNGSVSANFDYYNMKQFVNQCDDASRHGIKCDDLNVSDMWAQVWVVDEEGGVDNCGSHGYREGTPLFAVAKRAPFGLPVKFIENFKKDGDTFNTVCEYGRDGERLDEPVEITWVAAQGEFRYRRFGSIADALSRVVETCKAYRDYELTHYFEKLRELISKKQSGGGK
jgi:hypothetical protein